MTGRRRTPPPARRRPRQRQPGYLRSAPHRRRRRRTPPLFTLLPLVLALGIAGTVFALTRPASADIRVSPKDARVTFSGAALETTTAPGALRLGGLKAGAYTVRVERKGFAPISRRVELRRGRRARLTLALAPKALRVRLTLHAPGAKVTASDAHGNTLSRAVTMKNGIGRLAWTPKAGPVHIAVTAPGKNAFTRDLFLDAPLDLDVRLDPKGQLVHSTGTIPTSGAPKGVAVTPNGREAWATILNGPPSIEIFDTHSGRRTGEVDIGKYGAVEIVFNADGTRAYASQMETARVFEIDVRRRKVLRSMDTESAWSKVVELSPDGKTVYVANWSGDDVSEIDLASGSLRRRIRVADTPRGLYAEPGGTRLWVASFGTGDLERVDLATGEVTGVFRSPGGALRHLVGDAERGVLYASDMAKDCVWVTDLSSGTTRRFAKVDKKPNTIDLSPDGRVLFVSCRGENNAKSYYIPGPEWGSILLFDTRTGKPLDAVVGGNQCTALDVSRDGRLLVFSDFLDDRLRVYEVPSYETLLKGRGGRWDEHFADVRK